MVEIREESSEPHYSGSTNTHSRARQEGESDPNVGVSALEFLKNQPSEVALFLTRLITIYCSLSYVLPVGKLSAQHTAYSRAFFAAAATNAIRLHQRVGGVRFSRDFFLSVIAEDACHYLLYSILFVSAAPVTMALLPVFLFAVLHAASFCKRFCISTGNGTGFVARMLDEFIKNHSSNLLFVIAYSEIFIMPLFVALIFTGKGSIFFPIIYYRFLAFRYMSRRNDTTRIAFWQLRCSLERAVASPSCPLKVRDCAYAFIRLICRLCPT
ncbi:unnamed protein product [Enterobius vermicularis]|uniref:Transmembrane protein 33 n=1 Tax=Enterobius vermicularis TaxID=51028 RepID=A0A0N4UVY0_ENTVE|nr:unnamed protein product [Enterobius vermicularis]